MADVQPNGTVPVAALKSLIQALFAAKGLSDAAARRMANGLVEADQQGLGSHGVFQAPMYLERLKLGSVSLAERAALVSDNQAVAVLDAGHMLGHLAADQAMALAVEKAGAYGLGAVAMRQGFHFGVSGQYALQAARQGCVGIVMANSLPVMPAPGGSIPLAGTNPLSIAIPTADEPIILLDMATSAGSMGKIRSASRRGDPIPSHWAVGPDGNATTDAGEALKGMLLPSGGPKGFALAFMIDLICGLLSGGAWGSQVRMLYGDLSQPYDSSALFIALDVAHFRGLAAFEAEAERARAYVLNSPAQPGVRPRTPGQATWEKLQQQHEYVAIDPGVLAAVNRLAVELGAQPLTAKS